MVDMSEGSRMDSGFEVTVTNRLSHVEALGNHMKFVS